MKNKFFMALLISLMLMAIAGCAPGTAAQVNIPGVSIQISSPGPNPLVNTTDASGKVAGFLQGIWHGIISPVTEVLSFVNPAIQMYEVHNDGSEYNFGFLLGVAIVFVLLGAFAGSRRR